MSAMLYGFLDVEIGSLGHWEDRERSEAQEPSSRKINCRSVYGQDR